MRPLLPIFTLLILFFPCQINSDPRKQCKKHEFTDMVVSIQTDKVHRCNGVILSKNKVVTTALCVTDHLYRIANGCDCRKKVKIIYNLKMANLVDLYCAKEIGVVKTYIHKWFMRRDRWANYDVAVLITDGDMVLEANFKPPALPKSWNHTLGTFEVCESAAVVAGYWMNQTQKEPKAEIACLDVTISNFTLCQQVVGTKFPQHALSCTQDTVAKVGDLCKGHYGAPLFCQEKVEKKVTLRGFLSHRHGMKDECGTGTPIFYTRSDTVLPFLNDPEKDQ